MQPVATSRAPSLRAAPRARRVSIDSSRAASMKAHVFTTTTSASAAASAGVRPSARSCATILSESTAFLGQPSVSTQYLGPVTSVRLQGAPETGPRALIALNLVELLDGHEHRPRLRALRRADHAPTLQQVHDPPGPGETDAQLAWEHRRAAEAGAPHEVHRLLEKVVALVVVEEAAPRTL